MNVLENLRFQWCNLKIKFNRVMPFKISDKTGKFLLNYSNLF